MNPDGDNVDVDYSEGYEKEEGDVDLQTPPAANKAKHTKNDSLSEDQRICLGKRLDGTAMFSKGMNIAMVRKLKEVKATLTDVADMHMKILVVKNDRTSRPIISPDYFVQSITFFLWIWLQVWCMKCMPAENYNHGLK